MMALAYEIMPRGAGIREHLIPPGGIVIGDGVTLRAAAEDHAEDEHWRGWTLARVAEITARMAPWVTTWCAPAIMRGGQDWGGRCLAGCQTLAVSTSTGASHACATTYHELGHALDGYLLPGPRAVLDAATAGVDWPGDYLADPAERRARLIENACMSLDHGATLHAAPGSATEIAWACYTGEIARQRNAAIAAVDAARMGAPVLSRFGPTSVIFRQAA